MEETFGDTLKYKNEIAGGTLISKDGGTVAKWATKLTVNST